MNRYLFDTFYLLLSPKKINLFDFKLKWVFYVEKTAYTFLFGRAVVVFSLY